MFASAAVAFVIALVVMILGLATLEILRRRRIDPVGSIVRFFDAPTTPPVVIPPAAAAPAEMSS